MPITSIFSGGSCAICTMGVLGEAALLHLAVLQRDLAGLHPSRPVPEGVDAQWGVGEHTDYGLLTQLRQDDVGGLKV